MSAADPTVAICIVTFNSAEDLPACLQSIHRLTYRPLELVVVDCASIDRSLEIARQETQFFDFAVRILPADSNLGFAGGMNLALTAVQADYVLTLNPDARPEPEFIAALVSRSQAHPELRIGAVAGRLHRPTRDGASGLLDACGMRLSPTWRHFDRGSGCEDQGQWMSADRVFGATCAASLFLRSALLDVAIDDEIFATDFMTYREDAELCFRMQARGWEVLYEPLAKCEHRRHNLPSRRRAMPAEINFHSLKNRYLLRAYHQDPWNLLITGIPALFRDLMALTFVVLFERSSLGAYRWLWRHRRRIWQHRRRIMQRRTATSWHLNRWFLRRSLPL